MTYKEKRELLNSYRSSVIRIKGLQRELGEWEAIANNITQKIKPVMVNSSKTGSKLESDAIKILEIETQLNQELNAIIQTRTSVNDIINTVRDTRKRDILTLRYINGIPVREIARNRNVAEQNIHKIIKRTIQSINI